MSREIKIRADRKDGRVHIPKRKLTSQKFYFWDIETKPDPVYGDAKLHFEIAVVIEATISPEGEIVERREHTFCLLDQLIEYMLDQPAANRKTIWIAHNTGFDLQHAQVIPRMQEKGYKVSAYFSKGATTFIALYKKKKRITFIDTMNWFKSSLKEIGEEIGVPKSEIDFNTCKPLELIAYCVQDVEILVQVMARYKKWYSSIAEDNISYTRSGDAMRLAYNRMPETKWYIHKNYEQIQAEYDSYQGGRTEAFRQGDLSGSMIYALDVNSLYPYIMQTRKYAGAPVHDIPREDFESTVLEDNKYSTLAHVKVNISEPYLPFRSDMSLIFPVGSFTAWYTGDELKTLVERGDIEELYERYHYYRTTDFSSVIKPLYDARLKYKEAGEVLQANNTKLIMNSIYGKYGQLVEAIQPRHVCPPENMSDMPDYSDKAEYGDGIKEIGGWIYATSKNIASNTAAPIIASEITANARMYMWNMIKIAGRDNVVYMDTDSLFVSEAGRERLAHLEHDSDLGKLKLEKSGDDLHIYGPKHYSISDKHVIRGIQQDDIEVRDNVYVSKRFKSLTESLTRRHADKPDIYEREIELKASNTKCEHIDEYGYKPYTL